MGVAGVSFSPLYRKSPSLKKEGYFEELVLKREVEPKHSLSMSVIMLVLIRKQVLGTTWSPPRPKGRKARAKSELEGKALTLPPLQKGTQYTPVSTGSVSPVYSNT